MSYVLRFLNQLKQSSYNFYRLFLKISLFLALFDFLLIIYLETNSETFTMGYVKYL